MLYSGTTLYSRFVALSGLPNILGNWIQELQIPSMAILAVLILIYLALGCIMDSISMMTLTLPIIFPVTQVLGWDPLWFATVVVVVIELGLLTPPIGISVFVAKAVAGDDVTLVALFRAVIPFFFITLTTLILIIIFPQISTWLPSIMVN
ncbi:TRAP transporter large permease subunit [Thermodesulfobacteriota bacterium]